MENRIENHIGVPYKAPPISGGVKRIDKSKLICTETCTKERTLSGLKIATHHLLGSN